MHFQNTEIVFKLRTARSVSGAVALAAQPMRNQLHALRAAQRPEDPQLVPPVIRNATRFFPYFLLTQKFC